MKTIANENSKVYYQGTYWNDILQVSRFISKKLTGDENGLWIPDFKKRYAQKPFKHALFLNCGDGRWEREFVDRNIVKRVTAFDFSKDLLEKANNLKGKRSIKYILADVNKIRFKKQSFDLVVNIAALHHVQYINRLCNEILNSLKKDGYFISFDYVGPQRNQYPLLNWLIIKTVNMFLPKNIRKPNLGYPHLPTMLSMDPTEAIHSDLVSKTVYRFFNIVERHDVGGGVAYEILTHNSKINKRIINSSKNKYVDRILKLDNFLSKTGIIPIFFSYLITKPKKRDLSLIKENKYFQKMENIREKYSLELGNTYTTKDYYIIVRGANSWRKRLKLILRYIPINLIKTIKILGYNLYYK